MDVGAIWSANWLFKEREILLLRLLVTYAWHQGPAGARTTNIIVKARPQWHARRAWYPLACGRAERSSTAAMR